MFNLERIKWAGQPRRHLLTTGWSTFVTSKRLVAGESFVFLRGENGELRVGVRHVAHPQSSMPSSVISSQSMHLGVLATASHAIATQTLFVVYYKPRTSQFIISVNKYLEAVNNKFVVGMRFKMRFEGEDSPVTRFSGTIIGVDDFSPHWKDSKWRSLKVQWDEPASIPRPDRVSPWEIEPFAAPTPPNLAPPDAVKNKRPRLTTEIPALGNRKLPDSLLLCSCNSVSRTQISDGAWLASPDLNVSQHRFRDTVEESKGVFAYSAPHSLNLKNDLMFDPDDKARKTDTATSCRLFGIDLINSAASSTQLEQAPARPISVSGGTTEGHSLSTLSATDSDLKSKISKEPQEKEQEQSQISLKEINRQSTCNSARSRTKVQMQGIAVGRAVDLTMINGYTKLIDELEKMFDIKGQLHPRDKWEIVYTDDEGDMMLVGDDPWPEFCNIVRRIFICSSQDVKKMRPGTRRPMSSMEDEVTALSFDSAEN
ncbi:hypothetical protein SLE2022_086580 [Rubroshorea leprosula]